MICPVCGMPDVTGKCPRCGVDSTNLGRLAELPTAYYNRAIHFIRDNKLPEAREALLTTVGFDSNDTEALILLGKVCADMENYEEAISYWEKAKTLDESKVEPLKEYIEKAKSFMRKEGWEERLSETMKQENRLMRRWIVYVGLALVILGTAGGYLFYNKISAKIGMKEEEIVAIQRTEKALPEVMKTLRSYGFANIEAVEVNGIIYLKGKALTPYDRYKIWKIATESIIEGNIDLSRIKVIYPKGYYYKVKSGDNLWDIAKKLTGDSMNWTKIYEINKKDIEDPLKIQKGIHLLIPE